MLKIISLLMMLGPALCQAQDYFYERFKPFDPDIPSPQQFLGYGIGEHHTRHDRIVAYMELLAEKSDRASLFEYGQTYEDRRLVILTITTPDHLSNLESLRERHLAATDPTGEVSEYEALPVFIQLGYNVHGNEPSSSEAALLTAYTLVASEHPDITDYLEKSVLFVDPTINPDGRDRHTHWANMYQGQPEVADPQDAEHNEYWPGGRTNHYWFDLNRDWLLAIHPESRGKLDWYHRWYPNVVTDFHEMGTQSTYFFEPMKTNGSLNPIMPKENYVDLNETFGNYFAKALDSIGSLYFTKEVFDGTYPGYGSSYPDLQGGLGLLFEQASSRGHRQKTAFGEITFPFTIRNQYVSSLATIKAAVENRMVLRRYQRNFFKSALTNAAATRIRGYEFGDPMDANRTKAFIDKLLKHRIEVYRKDDRYLVPTGQAQYRMVQSMFESYDQYRDSVFYDASAWSVANFYNMKARALTSVRAGERINSVENLIAIDSVAPSAYGYVIDWNDYNAPAALYALQEEGLTLSAAFKPFAIDLGSSRKSFNYGTLYVPVSLQKKPADTVHGLMRKIQKRHQVPMYAVNSGYSPNGIDLGSRYVQPLRKPKAAMMIGTGVRAYEAGEVWHLLDTRVHMPISKLPLRNFDQLNLDKYNTLMMVSGTYDFNPDQQRKIIDWVKAGNTLITIGTASKFVIEKKWVHEELTDAKMDSLAKDTTQAPIRKPYVDAPENIGKESVGGIVVKVDLDRTHPLGFGYTDDQIPVYKNNEVWLKPSQNPYATVAKYADEPHMDGFITDKNLEENLKPSASLLVSPLGKGRIVLFADNPNFRGSWYGTNRLFLNALFLGNEITVPEID